eukprot:m.565072 g.565072  ORF g.565072 m.565072 type:complete len:171 (+) comp22239_c4_seq3:93-605(+)
MATVILVSLVLLHNLNRAHFAIMPGATYQHRLVAHSNPNLPVATHCTIMPENNEVEHWALCSKPRAWHGCSSSQKKLEADSARWLNVLVVCALQSVIEFQCHPDAPPSGHVGIVTMAEAYDTLESVADLQALLCAYLVNTMVGVRGVLRSACNRMLIGWRPQIVFCVVLR